MYFAGKTRYFRIKISHSSQERLQLPTTPTPRHGQKSDTRRLPEGVGVQISNRLMHYFSYLNTLFFRVSGTDVAP